NRRFYTRAGNFQIDADGRLIAANNGFVVQGITANTAGVFSSSSQIGDVILPLGQQTAPRETTGVTITGNLNANADVGDTHSLGVTVYDQTGTPYVVEVQFTNTGIGAWDWEATSPTADVTTGTGTVTFNSDGTLASFDYPGGGTGLTITPTSGADAFDIEIDAGTVDDLDGLAGFAGASSAVASGQDGYQSGQLLSIEIDNAGVITGVFSNGVSQALAQMALARFN